VELERLAVAWPDGGEASVVERALTTIGASSRSASAMTDASVPPSGESAYCSTGWAMRSKVLVAGGLDIQSAEAAQEGRLCRRTQSSTDEERRLGYHERRDDDPQVRPRQRAYRTHRFSRALRAR
jgi:hypothetical protein